MIIFSSPALWFRYCGLGLFCLHLLLFVACLPPFQAGTWFQTEPAMVAMFALGALDAAWIALGISKNWLSMEQPIHPLLYGLLAYAAWQFITMAFAGNPLRSWMGIPQTGEGSAWQVMLLLAVALAMPLWQENSYKKIILSIAAFSLCAMTWLHFNPRLLCPLYDNYIESDPSTPANWPDYLPLIAGWLWIAYAAAPGIRTPQRHLWMMVLFTAAMVVGENTAAKIMLRPLFIGANTIILLRLLFTRTRCKSLRVAHLFSHCFQVGKIWKILAVIGIFLPLAWLVISRQPELYTCKRTTSAENALAARAIFNQAAIATIAHEPSRLLVGNGWGNFSDDMLKYGMVDGLTSFVNGEFSPNSLWLYKNTFHPHSQPIAVLVSQGVTGFILFMALPVLAFWPLRGSLFWWCVPVLIGINATGFMWFTLPQVMPFQALAFAALCAGRPARNHAIMPFPKWVLAASAVCVLLLSASCWQQLRIIAYGERLAHILGEDPNQEGITGWLAEDINSGGDRLIEAAEHYAARITTRVNEGVATGRDRDWYRNFLEIAHSAAMSPDAGARLAKLDVDLSMLPFRLVQNSPLDDLKPEIKGNLLDSMVNISAKAPLREDLIASFLMSLDGFTNGDNSKQRDILEHILNAAPNHRSALWLLGTLDEASPQTRQQGFEMKKRAAKLGVQRVYPITREELSPYLEYSHSE